MRGSMCWEDEESMRKQKAPPRYILSGMTNIVFVDEHDTSIGSGSKQEAIEKGIIHRVVRIFITNSRGEVLLQKRAAHIKTGPGKWDQSVGGHVDVGEEYDEAAHRELKEELGIKGISLKQVRKYYAEGEDPPHRKRFNMLYTGVYDGEVSPEPKEVSDVKWISPANLEAWIERSPDDFTKGCINAWGLLKERSV